MWLFLPLFFPPQFAPAGDLIFEVYLEKREPEKCCLIKVRVCISVLLLVWICVCMCTCFPKGPGSEVKKWGRGCRQVKLEKGWGWKDWEARVDDGIGPRRPWFNLMGVPHIGTNQETFDLIVWVIAFYEAYRPVQVREDFFFIVFVFVNRVTAGWQQGSKGAQGYRAALSSAV